MSEICLPAGFSGTTFVFGATAAAAPAHLAEVAETNNALMRRLQERDPDAMAVIYDRYGKFVFSVIFRAVRDRHVAEDLVQETFLRIWNRAGSFDLHRGGMSTWILTIARNRAIDYLRSVEGRLSAGAVELRETIDSFAFADGEQEAMVASQKGRLEEALRKLTPLHREVIQLAYYRGMTQVEMAQEIRQPLGTVKTWVRAALRALREEMC